MSPTRSPRPHAGCARPARWPGARRAARALAPLTLIATAVLVTAAPAPAYTARQRAIPSQNRRMRAATWTACAQAPSGTTCRDDALADIDAARASEGVVPMALPADFAGLPVAAQLLVLANLERVDRGLPAIIGLSAGLDRDADAAARTQSDPRPSRWYGTSYAANEAGPGFATALEADFEWMYDDGPGSPNVDCPSAGAPGCWGHRRDILMGFASPIVMGGGTAGAGADRTFTEVFVGGDTQTRPGHPDAPIAPTWRSIARTEPLGVSVTTLRLAHAARRGTITVWASGVPMAVRAALLAGADGWSVSPSRCSLPAGSSCRLTVRVGGAGIGHSARLQLAGPDGRRDVALSSAG